MVCVIALCFAFVPYTALAVDEAVPDGHQGYVPSSPSEPIEEGTGPKDTDDGNFITRGVAKLVNMLVLAVETAIGTMDLEGVIFGKNNPINGKTYDGNSLGRVFSAEEWNYAINPVRIAFTFVAWIFFAIMIASYGIRVMNESTSPLRRAQLQEDLMAWIAGAAMLAFMYMIVFVIFNLNWAFVKGLRNLISGNAVYNDVFETLKDPQKGQNSLTGGPFGDALVNLFFAVMTAVLIIRYIYRKFIIGFLVIIGPLAAVAFARKKDGMAFKMWLAELMSQVFLQTGHAIVIVLYFAFLNVSISGKGGLFSDAKLGSIKNNVEAVLDPVLAFIVAIGGVVAVGALMLNGIRLAGSSGNPSARASAIKGIQYSLIGCLICIGAVIVVNLVRGLMF